MEQPSRSERYELPARSPANERSSEHAERTFSDRPQEAKRWRWPVQAGAARKKRKEFVVVGLGRFGASVAQTLTSYGHQVLAIDSDEALVQQLSATLPHVVQLDATREAGLRELEIGRFDTGLVSIGGDFESSLLATVLLLRLGVRRVITKAHTRMQQEILERVGAQQVILPEYEAGIRLARTLAHAHIEDYLEVSPDVGVVECRAPRSITGRTLRAIKLRQSHGLSVIAIRRDDNTIVNPGPEEIVHGGDVLVVVGRIEDAERLKD